MTIKKKKRFESLTSFYGEIFLPNKRRISDEKSLIDSFIAVRVLELHTQIRAVQNIF